jgi:hypothetical protein
VACSPVGVQWTTDWTGLESSGLGIAPANLAWQEGHWNPLESTGVHWSPLESTWITCGRVKTSPEGSARKGQQQHHQREEDTGQAGEEHSCCPVRRKPFISIDIIFHFVSDGLNPNTFTTPTVSLTSLKRNHATDRRLGPYDPQSVQLVLADPHQMRRRRRREMRMRKQCWLLK